MKREGEYPALRMVGKKVLGVEIQREGEVGGHDPVSPFTLEARLVPQGRCLFLVPRSYLFTMMII